MTKATAKISMSSVVPIPDKEDHLRRLFCLLITRCQTPSFTLTLQLHQDWNDFADTITIAKSGQQYKHQDSESCIKWTFPLFQFRAFCFNILLIGILRCIRPSLSAQSMI